LENGGSGDGSCSGDGSSGGDSGCGAYGFSHGANRAQAGSAGDTAGNELADLLGGFQIDA